MTIQEHIKAIAQKMGIAYIYHDWTTANVMIENAELPVMINVLPVSGRIRIDGYAFKESANCMVAFLDKADYDFDAEENEITVTRMKNLAKRFLAEVMRRDAFEDVDLSTVDYQVVYDKMDVNLTGIILELTINSAEGECIG